MSRERPSADPLADPRPLIRRVYGYVAFRIGGGADAEDVTSEVFERALRYRETYDKSKGTPTAWLLGIAQRCVDDALRRRPMESAREKVGVRIGIEAEAIDRVSFERALAQLTPRDRDLLALRYGVGLSTKQIAEALELTSGAVDVAVHRARSRLRSALQREDDGAGWNPQDGKGEPSRA
jgi:RNA polymerase sigma factor (sigma-70 family)